MQNYDVISKGAYARPQSENLVFVTGFLFIRQEGKKYLLLKLKNPRGEAVGEINLKVTLLNAKGRTVNVLRLSSDKGGAANGSFAFGEKIEVGEDCCDFIAKVESAAYGGYLYREDGAAEYAARGRTEQFDVSAKKEAMGGKTRTVARRRLGVPVLVTILTCLLLFCAALVTYFQLKDFINDATGFTYSGVEYVFEDADKAKGTNIIVTGYKGSRPNVVIPEKIDGYVVSEIREGAFEGNSKIKKLKIEGDVKIGGYAFSGCSKLVSVSMDKTTEVGEYAFEKCGSLTKLEISGDGEIALGGYAFSDCASLESIKINKNIIYPKDVAIFSGDNAVKELRLENYDGDGCGKIEDLFSGANPSLKNLNIGYINGICESFCSGFSSLESVSIAYIYGDSYGIGDYAFRGTKLNTLKIPEGLTSVGSKAFESTEISSFNADGVESIGSYAFSDCKKLKSFTVPESLTSLSRGIFNACSSLESVTFENGEKLESVGDYAFSYCAGLKTVEIPEGVQYLGYQLFYGCENLQSLTVPYLGGTAFDSDVLNYLFGSAIYLKSITLTNARTLAPDAFTGCETLKEINLNEGITYIGDYAFAGCTALKSLVIPSTVNDAGYGIFESCFRLFEIYNLSGAQMSCDYALAVYSSLDDSIPKVTRDGFTVALSDGGYAQPAGWYLIGYPEESDLVLPQSFDGADSYSVIDYLFYLEELTSITFSDTVAGFGKSAFYGCRQLSEISAPQSAPIVAIGNDALRGCKALTSFSLPDAVTRIGDDAFNGCSSLASVKFNENLTDIGFAAFENCTALTEIDIPNKDALTLGYCAFFGCNALKSVRCGSVTEICGGAFSNDTALEYVEIAGADGAVGDAAFKGCTALSEIVIPNGATYIAADAFADCKNLNRVTLPQSLERIYDGAFANCPKLRAVVNYSGIQVANDDENGGVGKLAVFIVRDFTDAQLLAYTEIDGITYLHLRSDWVAVWRGAGVTSINLKEISYGGNKYPVLKIASYAFTDDLQITSASLSGVTDVGEYAFSGCKNLKEVRFLTSGVEQIKDGTFANCSSLQSVTLPESLVEIGDYAFSYADLRGLILPSAVKRVGCRAFQSNLSLESVSLSPSLKTLGDYAFFRCSKLAAINLQDTKIEYLGEGAFINCAALNYLSLPRTLSEIPAMAFYYCSSLADAVIPSSVTYIGEEAFYGCSSLLQVHNLSNLNLRAGGSSDGYCAFYALYVFDNADEQMLFAEKDRYKFARYNGNWYLYRCDNYDTYKKLPEDFSYGNETVSTYGIRDNAFSFSAAAVIPTSVKFIEREAFTYPRAIYYCGTPVEWRSIRPSSLSDAVVYYYSECIHTDDGNIWTYLNGSPYTGQTALVVTEVVSPTCTAEGQSTGTCRICGLTRTEKTAMLYHSYGSDGKCLRCGAQGETAQSLNGSFESYSITSYNFAAENGVYTSTNDSSGSFAKITVTAQQDIHVYFGGYTTSYFNNVTVTVDGETVAEFASYEMEYKVALSKGQSLNITFSKGGYQTIGEARITYILIFA